MTEISQQQVEQRGWLFNLLIGLGLAPLCWMLLASSVITYVDLDGERWVADPLTHRYQHRNPDGALVPQVFYQHTEGQYTKETWILPMRHMTPVVMRTTVDDPGLIRKLERIRHRSKLQ